MVTFYYWYSQSMREYIGEGGDLLLSPVAQRQIVLANLPAVVG